MYLGCPALLSRGKNTFFILHASVPEVNLVSLTQKSHHFVQEKKTFLQKCSIVFPSAWAQNVQLPLLFHFFSVSAICTGSAVYCTLVANNLTVHQVPYHHKTPRKVWCLQLLLCLKPWLFAPPTHARLSVSFHTGTRWLHYTRHSPVTDD